MKNTNYKQKRYVFNYFRGRNILNKKYYNLPQTNTVSKSPRAAAIIMLSILTLATIAIGISLLVR